MPIQFICRIARRADQQGVRSAQSGVVPLASCDKWSTVDQTVNLNLRKHLRAGKLFGHTARSGVELDHHRALPAAIRGPSPAWRRPPGRPRQTWTRTFEADLRPLNIELHTAWCRAQDRTTWKKLMRTATPCPGACY